MMYRWLANGVVLTHGAFIVFVIAGGLLALKWPRAAWIHLPCAVWGILVEWMGWICPLTPLENRLRRMAGDAGYGQGFIEHYIIPVIYPGGLTRTVQIVLGALVLLLNLWIYSVVFGRRTARGKSYGDTR